MIAASVGGGGDVFPLVTSLPASPSIGEAITLSLTGRNVVLIYDGTNWVPVHSLGAMTMYVDGGSGTDSPTKGTGTGSDAFATIQYAIDQIPGSVGGNVVINIASGTYAEKVTIKGKTFISNYSITLIGTLSEQLSATLDSAVQGSGATQGSITDTGAFGSYDNKLIYSSSLDEYRIIDSDTTNTATIVGTWSGVPSGNYKVYDWATIIDGSATREYCIEIGAGQTSVYFENIKTQGATTSNIKHSKNTSSFFTRCSGYASEVNSYVNYMPESHTYISEDVCYSNGVATALLFRVSNAASISILIERSKLNSAIQGIVLHGCSFLFLTKGSVLNGLTSFGLNIYGNSHVNCFSASSDGYIRIRNCGTGLKARYGGQIIVTADNQYSGNTTDEDADAASYGHID